MKLLGHPSAHGHHVNPYTCLRGEHRYCNGFSGDYDTFSCGCCCHDAERDPRYELSDQDRAIVRRMKGEGL